MKKVGYSILTLLLICPIVTVSAEKIGEINSSKNVENSISETMSTSSSVSSAEITSQSEGYTSASVPERQMKSEQKIETEEEINKKIEELAKNAKTPEEYAEVLEFIKKNTDYDQSEKGDDWENRASSPYRASNKQGVAEFLGISKAQLLNELQRHENDGFYLGTPFRGLWTPSIQCMSPKGAPNSYGPGFNCTGFVATAFQRAGGDLGNITRVANAWGDVCNAYNWRDALRPNTEHYAFNSVNELLASGKAEKGDVIYFEPNYNDANYDCHIGFFWGNRSNENLMWHSYDRNIKSNIKSATRFTKIYLFKLGNDKNETIYDKAMNNERFVEKSGATIYSKAFTSGTSAIDTTNGLYHQQVHVSRELSNGYGTWQEITYKRNGQTKKGWLRSNELTDIIDQKNKDEMLALNTQRAFLYSKPYYPGVQVSKELNNLRSRPMRVLQEAVTGYGKWYKVSFTDGSINRSGWLRENELSKIVSQQVINKKMTVNKDYGTIFDGPFVSSNETKKIGTTKDIVNQIVEVKEEAYTGYGKWYKVNLNNQSGISSGWIKSVDLGEYTNYSKLNTRKFVNKNYGSVYDTPYVSGVAKEIDNLNGMKNKVVSISGKASTNYGVWYEVSYFKGPRIVTGWIKETDLVDMIDDLKINEERTVLIDYGSLFEDAYLGPDTAKLIGKTEKLVNTTVSLDRKVITGYGTWYHIKKSKEEELSNTWIKDVDLGNYKNYEKLNTRMIVNKNYGSIYDVPYIKGESREVYRLDGWNNQSLAISAKAETFFGTWYEVTYQGNKKGWVKSTDLEKRMNEKKIEEKRTVLIDNGSLFNEAYTGPDYTQQVGTTKELVNKSILLDKVVTTGYGLWYHVKADNEGNLMDKWIKYTDIANFYDYEKLNTRKLVNKNYGSIYDVPYVRGEAKEIGSLDGQKNKVYSVTAVAKTNYGVWYEVLINQNVKGWIKTNDLVDTIDNRDISEIKTVIVDYGSLFDKAYIGPDNTKELSTTKDLYQKQVVLDHVTVNGYGTWYHIKEDKKGNSINMWIKSVDLK